MTTEEYAEYVDMLRKWRFAPVGTPLFQIGNPEFEKWQKRFNELRDKATDGQLPKASKEVGW